MVCYRLEPVEPVAWKEVVAALRTLLSAELTVRGLGMDPRDLCRSRTGKDARPARRAELQHWYGHRVAPPS